MTPMVVRVTIAGRVQGVGYRVWLRDAALDAGVTGWARNRRNGAVEAILAGEAEALQSLIELCRVGPRGASVTTIDATPSTDPAPVGFAILRDE